MSEPNEDDLERAERIRQLRSGGAKSRSQEMRERRREQARDGDRPLGDRTDGTDDGADADSIDGDDAVDGAGSTDDAAASPLPAAGDVDVLSLATELPEDGSLFVVPVREGLRREFNKVAEQLHLRYGFEYRSELDAEHHVRPLALYLGVQALADSDVEAVRELLESVDELEAPEEREE